MDRLSSCIIHNLEGIKNLMQSLALFAGVAFNREQSLLACGGDIHAQLHAHAQC